MDHDITLTVNGTEHELEVESRTLLVHALRDELGYTGPNVGCESSTCGACTVHLDDRAIKSCTLLAVQADGGDVTTIEGIGDAEHLHPIQESFNEEHGLQCGYCTPGMIMTTKQLLADNPSPTEEEIREGLEGNLCRCTGYQNIVHAVDSAAKKLRESDEGVAGEGVTDGGSIRAEAIDDGTNRGESVDDGTVDDGTVDGGATGDEAADGLGGGD